MTATGEFIVVQSMAEGVPFGCANLKTLPDRTTAVINELNVLENKALDQRFVSL